LQNKGDGLRRWLYMQVNTTESCVIGQIAKIVVSNIVHADSVNSTILKSCDSDVLKSLGNHTPMQLCIAKLTGMEEK
jgi:hypothetical protein